MIDYAYNWMAELDDGRDRTDTRARAKCAGCDALVHPSTLSPSGHCPVCVGRGQDDARELRAEAMRRP